jgi:hypothetical protein
LDKLRLNRFCRVFSQRGFKRTNRSFYVAVFSITVLLSLFLVIPVDARVYSKSAWQIDTIDSPISSPSSSWGGGFTSLALDSNNYPHISYLNSVNMDLMYARWNGLSWIIETVDSQGITGDMSSLALDSHDRPHISYMATSGSDNDLKYAYWDGVSWHIETVDSQGCAGGFSSIALDSHDNPHISYHTWTPDYDLKYASWTGTSWVIETVDSQATVVGRECSLALDSTDKPCIAYGSTEFINGQTVVVLKYAQWNGAAWIIDTLDETIRVSWYWSDAGVVLSLALDSNNRPYICYYKWSQTVSQTKYAVWDGTSWNIEVISSDTYSSLSLAIDSQDKPHIILQRPSASGFDLSYAHLNENSWIVETVDNDGTTGYLPSIALDSNNKPHISYFDATTFALKYATTMPEWDLSVNAHVGAYSDLSRIGVRLDSTTGYDHAFDDVNPPAPPKGVDSYSWYPNNPASPIDLQKLSTSMVPPSIDMNWTYAVTTIGTSGTMTIDWSSQSVNSIPEEFLVLLLDSQGKTIANMRETSTYDFAGQVDQTYLFTIRVVIKSDFTLDLSPGWNMVSFPVIPPNTTFASIFSGVSYYQVVTWSGTSYTIPLNVEAGKGYWVLVLTPTSLKVTGTSVPTYSLDLPLGWNMIGSVYDKTVSSDSVFHSYYQLVSWSGTSYTDAKSAGIEPGKGYWALVFTPTHIVVG